MKPGITKLITRCSIHTNAAMQEMFLDCWGRYLYVLYCCKMYIVELVLKCYVVPSLYTSVFQHASVGDYVASVRCSGMNNKPFSVMSDTTDPA